MRGKFITFEGGEGTGKSTQAARLATSLKTAFEHDVELTREPGGSQLGESIRDLVLAQPPRDSRTEFLMFAAARVEHMTEKIRPALENGTWVICDRFIDSTRVYQGRLGNVESEFIRAVETFSVAQCMPDLTIILDVDPRVSMERTRARGALSRYDAGDETQHRILRDGFLDIARNEPARCIVIDGARDEDTVAQDILNAVRARLQI